MKKIFFVLLFLISSFLVVISCEDNSLAPLKKGEFSNEASQQLDTGIMQLNVDHYQLIGGVEGIGFHYVTQEGPEIEAEKWFFNYSSIENFDYEWGYRYQLIVNKKKFDPPLNDMPLFYYELIEVVQKKKVPDNESFQIPIHKSCSGCNPVLRGNQKDGFNLLGSMKIDCGKFCGELAEVKESGQPVLGTFTHSPGSTIDLVDLKKL